ncbi:FAD-dependent tricarballylate dehydrogenase TcuA [Amycolatopsis endophytica]|uniref:Tricarballylate dehydrogenase n=1 Tax=Amycolatopsis endophytica TaxID=860233 RepID=A0A853BAI4_9PSEU|nr:FAD-dependent tricarballylate dehydrogenase TcuA [Amycolatopsis endophytica]NYI92383.1 tricarballylate dehydrogenase [Amycolatopsis endophytica]
MTDTPTTVETDVLVVGGGNAGFSAAHSARERGVRVLLLERAPENEAGGNSFYTAGAYRLAHAGTDDLATIIAEGDPARLSRTVVPPYPAEAFTADMERVTEGRNDDALTEVLVRDSADAARWLAGKGIRWRLMYERQAYEDSGIYTFFGGLALGTVGGGKGLIAQHTEAARASGIEVRYASQVTALHRADDGAVTAVTVAGPHGEYRINAGAIVLAAGGFEANPRLRARHLGPEWEQAMVRGTPTNDGQILELALGIGAAPHGDYGTCHSVAWDVGAPPRGGDRHLTNQYTRQSYPLGIVVDRGGRRFVDEGADYRNYTYAKYGREILRRPGGIAWQLFDATTRPMLRTEEYDSEPITTATADTVEDLAAKLGIDPDGLRRTVEEFNAAIDPRPFNAAVKDERRARVDPPKSNWALALDTPPFHGYAVSCGITFTFGGLHITTGAQVLDTAGTPIPGLFAAGELVGGLFSGNYPGGTGLTSGTVFGRLAGAGATERATVVSVR